ncbi:G-D-S-L family lipolytic protein [Pedobacter sp. SD-b]|uniref:G-D-S-L family lipolytic protein n=1 Tax=Pedobacter segetis TaxID=2793069 RepID=A0ABS1BIZ0_9SPHI|nr:SGNH/GDSL hydrolase family protein [Pedobacter segetis]MBK0382830.1 G-D-S-L family lipolytic protein [Pedobacter segetis]
MKKYNSLKLLLAGLILITAACDTKIDAPTLSKGSADFTKYIAVGNSLTSGYADGGLYLDGQLNSFPSIIAKQMKLVGGGAFNQSLFDDAHSNGSGYLSLGGFNPNGTPILNQVTDKLAYRDAMGHFIKFTGDIENLGIPGMRLDLGAAAPTFSALNPYFERLLPDAQVGNTTYLNFIAGRSHTFFSFWLGNNDVLGWATNGGVVNNDPTKALTSKANFTNLYSAFIGTLTAQGQKGVVATIPDVTAIPYFNTVTVSAINAGLKANPQTANYSLVINALNPATGLHSPRLATSADLIILTFNTASIGVNGYGLSPLNPIKDEQVLDKDEVAIAKDYVNSYNTSIKTIAAAKGLAVFDAYAFLNQFKGAGISVDGVAASSSYISGNVFSLDGVHLTPFGYAIAANGFINSINSTYGSTIPTVNTADYRFVKFP